MKIIIFAGTTEGHELAKYCEQNKIKAIVSVATEYGEEIMGKYEYISIISGRMNESQMKDFIIKNKCNHIFDATHPYATEVTKNIKKVANNLELKLYRIVRKENEKLENIRYFETIELAANYLEKCTGNIMVTTGSKEIYKYNIITDKNRMFFRVLPTMDALEKCSNNYVISKNIIAMQGPFSLELNKSLIKQYNIKYLVTKSSGKKGGFLEKIEACMSESIIPIVISRPEKEDGISLEQAKDLIKNNKKISIIGIGMGNIETLTQKAKCLIENADICIGANRMLEYPIKLGKKVFASYKALEIKEFLDIHNEYKNIAILMSGDVGYYSGAKNIQKVLNNNNIEFVAGISSVNYFAAKLKTSWNDMKLLSKHGRYVDLIKECANNRKIFSLMSKGHEINELCEALIQNNMNDVIVCVGERLSYKDEKIYKNTAKKLVSKEFKDLSVIVLINETLQKPNLIKETNFPRILITGVKSGSGKTLITCGIMKNLKNKGFDISAFKCGPDYIDPMFHSKVIGIPSRNLDPYFCDKKTLKQVFSNNAKEISIVEGVMGYFDGIGFDVKGSTYEVSTKLDIPTILVLDAKGSSSSLVAMIKGFLKYQENSKIQAVILNNISSMMYIFLKKLIEEQLDIKVIGYVPRLKDIALESRHLGLIMPNEIKNLDDNLNELASILEQTIDFELLLDISRNCEIIKQTKNEKLEKYKLEKEIVIAVAKDEAFCFMYEDNIECLKSIGAKIVYFSPIHDSKLPKSDGIILSGGYPELYAKQLANNKTIKIEIKKAIAKGIPIIAECGGFMYLNTYLEQDEMVGVIDAKVSATNRLKRFGYIELESLTDNMLLKKGETLKAHEFHYFDSTNNGSDILATKASKTKSWKCIHANENMFIGFPHIYFYSKPIVAYRFLKKCIENKEKRNDL